MQSITSGVYSLLVGGDASDGATPSLPPPMQPERTANAMAPMAPTAPTPPTPPTPAATGCGVSGIPTRIVLGPGDGSVACLEECLAIADPMVREANANRNRVTVVLLKATTTPVALEEHLRLHFEGTSTATAAMRKVQIGKKREHTAVEADADEDAVFAVADGRTVPMNTGRPCVLLVTDCSMTYYATAPAPSAIPLARDAEEGYQALVATLRGILTGRAVGRDLQGTALGTFVRDDVAMRLISWHEGAEAARPVPALYMAVSEAYAQHAAGGKPRRPTAKPWFHITGVVYLGDAIPVSVDGMPALDQPVWQERLGVRAWFPAPGRSRERLQMATRDDDNLVGRNVGIAHDKLVFF